MEKEKKILQEVQEVITSVCFGLVSASSKSEFELLLRDIRVSKDRLKSIKKTINKALKPQFIELWNTIEDLNAKIQEKIDLIVNSDI